LSGEGGALRWVLETPPVVHLGLISYSLYVWQQLFTHWNGMCWSNPAGRIGASVGTAILSYYLLEIPMRKKIRRWFAQPQ
jgi:peptidoglycan/LPS O-acetylase OafA/YrhL